MMKTKSEKGNLPEGEYKLVRVTSNLSPIVYKEMRKAMEDIGLPNESSFIAMSVKLMTEKLLHQNGK